MADPLSHPCNSYAGMHVNPIQLSGCYSLTLILNFQRNTTGTAGWPNLCSLAAGMAMNVGEAFLQLAGNMPPFIVLGLQQAVRQFPKLFRLLHGVSLSSRGSAE